MTTRHHARRASVALAVTLAVGAVGAAHASAAAAAAPGGETVHVALGAGERTLVDGSLLGGLVVVPGDAGSGSVLVTNDGPTAGTLTAAIVNASALTDPAHPGWVDDEFYDHLTVNGIASSALVGRTTVLSTTVLEPGETTELTLGYAFDGWTGNRLGGGVHPDDGLVNPDGVGPREFSFDVLLTIADGTVAAGGLEATADDGRSGYLAATGGTAVPGRSWLLAVAGGAAVVAALGARAVLAPTPRRSAP